MAERKDNVLERVMQVMGNNHEDLLSSIVEIFLQKVLEAEMTDYIGAKKYERTSTRKGHQNGYKPRALVTRKKFELQNRTKFCIVMTFFP